LIQLGVIAGTSYVGPSQPGNHGSNGGPPVPAMEECPICLEEMEKTQMHQLGKMSHSLLVHALTICMDSVALLDESFVPIMIRSEHDLDQGQW
jgi:hypothetical protein